MSCIPERNWSIIIPALNEEAHIGVCLEALAQQTYVAEILEIIVADNGSVDRTVEIAKSYAPRLPISVVSQPRMPVGAVRNGAASLAHGRFLAFVDADCIVRANWLRDATAAINAYPSSIIGSPYALPDNAAWAAQVWHRRFHSRKQGAVSYVPGGSLLVEASIFWGVGGFSASLHSNEDSEFCSRARAAGIPVISVAGLAAIHLGAEKNLLHFAKRQMWHGSNVVNSSSLTGNVRAIGLAAYTLGCVVCVLCAALLGSLPWMFGMLAALLIPPCFLALRRPPGPRSLRDLPSLILLLLTYALVRAWVLPLACVRGFRYLAAREKSA